MFFRRERPKKPSLAERLETAKQAGFTVTPLDGGGVEISRGDIVRREGTGVRMGGEIGYLVDGGYQKFFRTPSGRERPALARDLEALHDFEEDLREALGQESLYNEALGTVSTYYQYDRVKDRDQGVPKRAWE